MRYNFSILLCIIKIDKMVITIMYVGDSEIVRLL